MLKMKLTCAWDNPYVNVMVTTVLCLYEVIFIGSHASVRSMCIVVTLALCNCEISCIYQYKEMLHPIITCPASF